MNPITQLLDQVEAGRGIQASLFAPDVTLDATVPNWRMDVRGAAQVAEQMSGWYRDPGTLEALRRIEVPDGEIVELTLAWAEGGIPHTANQTFHVDVTDGTISSLRVWCGGRWPAQLLAEMEAANMANA